MQLMNGSCFGNVKCSIFYSLRNVKPWKDKPHNTTQNISSNWIYIVYSLCTFQVTLFGRIIYLQHYWCDFFISLSNTVLNYVISVINNADPRDSGVYTCMLFQESGSSAVMNVISLAVKPQTPTVSTRETQQLTLHCHSKVLAYIYRDLTQKWEVNGVLWKDYGLTTSAIVSKTEPL